MSAKNRAWADLKSAMDERQGKCYDPETGEGEQPIAPEFCVGCPIQALCWSYAKADRATDGVWGGAVWEEREARPKW